MDWKQDWKKGCIYFMILWISIRKLLNPGSRRMRDLSAKGYGGNYDTDSEA